jgi:hypothetical protein
MQRESNCKGDEGKLVNRASDLRRKTDKGDIQKRGKIALYTVKGEFSEGADLRKG